MKNITTHTEISEDSAKISIKIDLNIIINIDINLIRDDKKIIISISENDKKTLNISANSYDELGRLLNINDDYESIILGIMTITVPETIIDCLYE